MRPRRWTIGVRCSNNAWMRGSCCCASQTIVAPRADALRPDCARRSARARNRRDDREVHGAAALRARASDAPVAVPRAGDSPLRARRRRRRGQHARQRAIDLVSRVADALRATNDDSLAWLSDAQPVLNEYVNALYRLNPIQPKQVFAVLETYYGQPVAPRAARETGWRGFRSLPDGAAESDRCDRGARKAASVRRWGRSQTGSNSWAWSACCSTAI